jgi:hypothetical protein
MKGTLNEIAAVENKSASDGQLYSAPDILNKRCKTYPLS